MKRLFQINLLVKLIFLILLGGSIPSAVQAQFDPDAIKSAYLERFTQFIDWPSTNNSDTADYFTIGMLEEDDFGKVLSDVFSYKTILGKKVRFLRIQDPEDLASCRLCYVNGIRRQQLALYTTAAQKSGVLLISDTPGFGKYGVHFNFVLVDNKVRFEINEQALKESGFKVSHLLYNSGILL